MDKEINLTVPTPEPLLEQLRDRAKQNGRSVGREALLIIRAGMPTDAPRPGKRKARASA